MKYLSDFNISMLLYIHSTLLSPNTSVSHLDCGQKKGQRPAMSEQMVTVKQFLDEPLTIERVKLEAVLAVAFEARPCA